MKYYLIVLYTIFVALSASARPKQRHRMRIRMVVPQAVDTTMRHYEKEFQRLTRERDSLLATPSTLTSPDGYSMRLIAPTTVYSSALMQQFSAQMPDVGQDESLVRSQLVNDALARLYIQNPQLVGQTQAQLDNAGGLRPGMDSTMKSDIRLIDKITTADLDADLGEPTTLYTYKPNFWKFSGNGSLQFTQSYFSQNWYQGGESNYAGTAMLTLQLNYDNKQHTQWENKLEFQLGFQTSPSDTKHDLKPTSNLVRLTSKYGRKAVSTLYYTTQLLTYTQLIPQYDNNSDNLRSNFLGPLYVNLSAGLDFKWNVKNRFSGDIYVAPGSYNLRYVKNTELASLYGIPSGEHCLHDGGSSITINWNWTIWKNITYQSRMYFFSNYHYVNFEWENTFNFTINKYLSTKLFLYPKYDNSSTNYDKGSGYFMFREWLSLGLNYNW